LPSCLVQVALKLCATYTSSPAFYGFFPLLTWIPLALIMCINLLVTFELPLAISRMRVVHGFLIPIHAAYYHLQPPMDSKNTFKPANTSSIHMLNHLHPQHIYSSDTNHNSWLKHQVKHHMFQRCQVSRSPHHYIAIQRPQIRSQSHTTNV